RLDAVRAHGARGIGEAGDERGLRRVVVDALRDRRATGIPAQVDVQLAARGAEPGPLPDPALEVAPVAAQRVDVVPPAPDDAVERIRQVRRAVDRHADPPRELLPARKRLRGTLPPSGVRDPPRISR